MIVGVRTVDLGSPNNEERRLFAEYETATRCYSWFVNELSRQRCMLSQDAFQQLLKVVEHTRLECERVRLAIGEFKARKK